MKQLAAALLVTLLLINHLSESYVDGQLTFSKSWSSGRKRSGPLAIGQKVTTRLESLLKVSV